MPAAFFVATTPRSSTSRGRRTSGVTCESSEAAGIQTATAACRDEAAVYELPHWAGCSSGNRCRATVRGGRHTCGEEGWESQYTETIQLQDCAYIHGNRTYGEPDSREESNCNVTHEGNYTRVENQSQTQHRGRCLLFASPQIKVWPSLFTPHRPKHTAIPHH